MRPVLLAFAALVAAAVPASGQTLTGWPEVIDGDSLELDGETVRLHGIDAVEGPQDCLDGDGRSWRCGESAALALEKFLSEAPPVRCRIVDRDSYGRAVAICTRADGGEANAFMVAEGWALELRNFSGGAYTDLEADARYYGLGIWAGSFTRPSEWRNEDQPAARAPQRAADAGCQIKGNISSSGRRVYHTPDMDSWEGTRIDVAAGERWFCTVAEAVAAGWSAP